MMNPSFSVVLPYFNEADFLAETLTCWVSQTRPPEELILIDNASTDGSGELCRSFLRPYQGMLICHHLNEGRLGKTRALETGCARAEGSWVVFSDADTFYPPRYLETLEWLIAKSPSQVVAVMALPVIGDAGRRLSVAQRHAYVLLSKIFRKHVYTGGYGQCLRRDVLRRSGGYSEDLWPYVLADHEVMSRVLKYGASLYHPDFWCRSSSRREDRRHVRWNLWEMVLYHSTPFFLQERFFVRFLGPRFSRRGMNIRSLRRQPWQQKDG
jgi:glycosyltransferase involved in cell wall biosynthesis